MPPLRAATADDTDAVIELLRLAHREVPHGRWVEARVREMVGRCLIEGGIILSLSHERPVGTLGFGLERWWWSDDPVLQERWVFVHPEHRRAPHAKGMLRTARAMAQMAGMPLLIGVLSTIRTAGKVRLFEREFGTPQGASFLVEG